VQVSTIKKIPESITNPNSIADDPGRETIAVVAKRLLFMATIF
jgi:hypothetical protein